MLLAEKTDAFTAMGTSISLVWNNLAVMLTWGAIVLALLLICFATVIAAALTLAVILRARYSNALNEGDQTSETTTEFLRFVSGTIAAHATVAILWVGMAVLIMPPC